MQKKINDEIGDISFEDIKKLIFLMVGFGFGIGWIVFCFGFAIRALDFILPV